MEARRVILVTSCKGGVGKSTVSANLAMSLAASGRPTLLVDCDFGMCCLDLICGYEGVLYDITDVLFRGISLSQAVIRDSRSENMNFIAAPYSPQRYPTSAELEKMINDAAENLGITDFVIDTHGGESEITEQVAPLADIAIIVATHNMTSVRAAEKTDDYLRQNGVEKTRLVLNKFNERSVKKKQLPGIIDIIDRSHIKLIGVIPNDAGLEAAQEKGILADGMGHSNFSRAFGNIAKRLGGLSVPLMEGFRGIDRNIVYK